MTNSESEGNLCYTVTGTASKKKMKKKMMTRTLQGIETVTVQGAQCQELHQRIAGGQRQNNGTKASGQYYNSDEEQ